MKQSDGCNVASSRPLHCALIALLGAALATGTAIAAPTQPTYRIVVLPELPDTEYSEAKDISDAGQIVGDASQWGSNGFRYGISWGVAPYTPQRLVELAPNSPQSVVWAVNNAGFVVGSALMRVDTGYYYAAVMWDPSGAIVELGDLPGVPFTSKALDINASGAAVGYGAIPHHLWRPFMPFLWTAPGKAHRLRMDGPGGLLGGAAWALNDFGDIAGYYDLSLVARHAVRWPARQPRMQDLGDLPGGEDFSFAYAINNAGQVVGYGYSDLGMRAVLWDSDGTMTDLGDVGNGTDYQAVDINQAGHIVGNFIKPGFIRQAFLWTAKDGMLDLYNLIDPTDPLRELFGTSANVHAINAAGLIVGSMSSHAIVLVPQKD